MRAKEDHREQDSGEIAINEEANLVTNSGQKSRKREKREKRERKREKEIKTRRLWSKRGLREVLEVFWIQRVRTRAISGPKGKSS